MVADWGKPKKGKYSLYRLSCETVQWRMNVLDSSASIYSYVYCHVSLTVTLRILRYTANNNVNTVLDINVLSCRYGHKTDAWCQHKYCFHKISKIMMEKECIILYDIVFLSWPF